MGYVENFYLGADTDYSQGGYRFPFKRPVFKLRTEQNLTPNFAHFSITEKQNSAPDTSKKEQ